MGLKVRGVPVPDSWAKCSTDIFQKMVLDWEPEKGIKDRDRVKLYAILCGQPYEDLAKHSDPHLDALLWEASRFVYQEAISFEELPLPKFLETHGKHVLIPQKLGALTIGQNIHVRQAINAGKDPNGLISLVVAVYLQPLIDSVVVDGKEKPGPFNYERALEIEEGIKRLPIKVTYPIGFFFLKKLKPFGTRLWWSLHLTTRRKILSVLSLLNLRKANDLLATLKPLFWIVMLRLTPLILTMCTKRSSTPSFSF